MSVKEKRLATALGAKIVGRVPETHGGAFEAARLLHSVLELRQCLQPGKGLRPGRPTNADWVRHPKVPMTEETLQKLRAFARRMSSAERKVSPMQVAAQILEEALTECPAD